MNGLISLISLSALLLAVSGQFPTLSPSYSFQATTAATANDQPEFVGSTTVAVDVTRGLEYGDATITTAGNTERIISLYSQNDNAVYTSLDGVCTDTATDPNINPLDVNAWDLFAAGVESPVGTFTYTK